MKWTELALACALAAGGMAGAEAASEAQAAVHLEDGQALIRYRGLTVLLDPAEDAAALPPADLVLLHGCGPAVQGWLARQQLDRAVVVLADGACAGELRGRGVRRIQLLQLWSAYALRKGGASLRLTVMPGAASGLGALLDFSDGAGAPCRVYVGGEAGDAEMQALPARFPGADLAIVRRGGVPVMLRFSPPMPRTR